MFPCEGCETVECRLQKLEAECLKLRSAVVLMAALAAVILFSAGHRPETLKAKTVKAQEFILQDADGSVGARLGTDEGVLALVMEAPSGSGRAVLGLHPQGWPFLRFAGSGDRTQVLLTLYEDSPKLALYSASGKPVFEAPSRP
jgi:hypothetical protein